MREQLDADPRISQAWVDRFFDSTQVKVFAGEAGVGQAGVALGGGNDAAEEGNWKLTSDAFNDEAALPVEHTRYGANKSPSLLWGEPPAGTMEFALICEDGTADSSTHWVVYGIPVDVRELPVGLPRTPALPKHSGIKQGKNDFGTTGYAGPRPTKGSGPQTYRFRLLALDCAVSTKPNPTKDALNAAMEGHILDEFTLSCVFEKP